MMQQNTAKIYCQIIVKNAKKTPKKQENCDCYLEYEKVITNTYFMFECLKCGKKSLFLADYV